MRARLGDRRMKPEAKYRSALCKAANSCKGLTAVPIETGDIARSIPDLLVFSEANSQIIFIEAKVSYTKSKVSLRQWTPDQRKIGEALANMSKLAQGIQYRLAVQLHDGKSVMVTYYDALVLEHMKTSFVTGLTFKENTVSDKYYQRHFLQFM